MNLFERSESLSAFDQGVQYRAKAEMLCDQQDRDGRLLAYAVGKRAELNAHRDESGVWQDPNVNGFSMKHVWR
jgi:hypothetical protein